MRQCTAREIRLQTLLLRKVQVKVASLALERRQVPFISVVHVDQEGSLVVLVLLGVLVILVVYSSYTSSILVVLV